jgi:hypothetical protein
MLIVKESLLGEVRGWRALLCHGRESTILSAHNELVRWTKRDSGIGAGVSKQKPINCYLKIFYWNPFIAGYDCYHITKIHWKLLPMAICSSVFPTLSCTTLKVSVLILKLLIHFELIFVQGASCESNFSLAWADSFPSSIFEKSSFLHHMFWAPLSKINR